MYIFLEQTALSHKTLFSRKKNHCILRKERLPRRSDLVRKQRFLTRSCLATKQRLLTRSCFPTKQCLERKQCLLTKCCLASKQHLVREQRLLTKSCFRTKQRLGKKQQLLSCQKKKPHVYTILSCSTHVKKENCVTFSQEIKNPAHAEHYPNFIALRNLGTELFQPNVVWVVTVYLFYLMDVMYTCIISSCHYQYISPINPVQTSPCIFTD